MSDRTHLVILKMDSPGCIHAGYWNWGFSIWGGLHFTGTGTSTVLTADVAQPAKSRHKAKYFFMITQERLKQLLVYDADSGGFTWKPRPLGCVSGDAGSLSNGYIRICIDRERYRAHQLAWLYVHGEWPNSIIDHIDGNKSNNKITNLRLVDASKNKQNQPPRKDSKTGVTGVVWDKFYQRWKASIKVQGKTIRLGAHKDFFEAVCRRKSAEQLYFKEYSYGAML